MRPKRPTGFGFLAVCSLLCAGAMGSLLAMIPDDVPHLLAARFALGATGALALVTAEALWRVRPWAFGASLAFGGVFVVMPVAVTGMWEAIVVSALPALFILAALSIVHRGLFPHPPIRVPRSP